MKNYFLFPAWFKLVGWCLAIPGLVLGALYVIWDYNIPFLVVPGAEIGVVEYVTNELAVFMTVLGLLFIGFSKQIIEDELVANMRLNALQWAVFTYLLCYLFTLITADEILSIFKIEEYRSELNILLPLLLFNLRFYYLLKIKPDIFITDKIKLFSHRPYLVLGRVLALLGFSFIGYIVITDQLFSMDGTYQKLGVLTMLLGLFLWVFAKRREEDEGTAQLRLNALQASFYLHYLIILIGTATIFSLSYLLFLVLVQFTLLLLNMIILEAFLFKASLQLRAADKSLQNEEKSMDKHNSISVGKEPWS
ncbi:MAG: hypothetical protein EOO99_07820 [Pedobacter sp.]|nr:MAG: hypothetical protein EOO99_07820 [Pedobacter sp.]